MYAHRSILAAASPYFNAMFTNDVLEAKMQKVVIQGVGAKTMDSLLGFMYSGCLDVDQDNVQDLLMAGDMIGLEEVVEVCTRFLVDQLEPSNAAGIFRFASDRNCLQLKDACLPYIWENFPAVIKEEEFKDWPLDLVVGLLSSEQLRVDSEYQVLEAAIGWVQADIVGRRRFIFDLLRHVRLTLVPSKRLESFVVGCPDVSLRVALSSIKKEVAVSMALGRAMSGGAGSGSGPGAGARLGPSDGAGGDREGLLSGGHVLVQLNAQPRMAAKRSIYIIGGAKREFVRAWTRSESTFSSVEKLDVFGGSWKRVAPLACGRIQPGIALLQGRIFVAGGEVGSEILASAEVYDPIDDTWTQTAPMTVPRCEFGMCAHNGHLYAFGGWVGEDIGGVIECYDPIRDAWSVIGKMVEPRFSMGTVVLDSLIYLVGGCTNSRRHMQELVSYNPVGNNNINTILNC